MLGCGEKAQFSGSNPSSAKPSLGARIAQWKGSCPLILWSVAPNNPLLNLQLKQKYLPAQCNPKRSNQDVLPHQGEGPTRTLLKKLKGSSIH